MEISTGAGRKDRGKEKKGKRETTNLIISKSREVLVVVWRDLGKEGSFPFFAVTHRDVGPTKSPS